MAINASHNTPSSAPTTSSSSAWAAVLGPCASVLCLIHCVGFALLALLAPSFSSVLPHSELVDVGVLATVALSGGYALWNFRAARGYWISFASLLLAAVALLAIEKHGPSHLAVVGLSLLQLPLLARHFAARRKPPCCEHGTHVVSEG